MNRDLSAITALLCVVGFVTSLNRPAATQSRPEIPRTWSAAGVSTFELPLASAERSPVHVSDD